MKPKPCRHCHADLAVRVARCPECGGKDPTGAVARDDRIAMVLIVVFIVVVAVAWVTMRGGLP